MDLTPYVTAIRDDLNTAAAAGDETTQRAAATLSAALEPAVRLAVMNAMSDLAAEVTAALPEHVVDVRLDGKDVGVAVTSTAETAATDDANTDQAAGTSAAGAAQDDVGGDISRITLRMLEQLKGQAEQAAANQGVSLNTYVSQAVQGALRGATQRRKGPPYGNPGSGGDHLHGWVQS